MSEETKHSLLPPSACERWIQCPGSIVLSDGTKETSSKYAAEGTLAHSLCEQLLKNKITNNKLEELIGDTQMVEEYEIEITEEMVDAVRLFAKKVVEKAKELKIKPRQIHHAMDVEQKQVISKNMWGTADVVLVAPFNKLVVVDFKYGAGIPVSVKDNKQLMSYAVGAWNNYAKGTPGIFETIDIIIIQPRANHKDGPVRVDTLTENELISWEKKLHGYIDIAMNEYNKYKETGSIDHITCNPGDWCKWCDGKHKCPVLFDEQNALAKQAFNQEDGLTNPSDLSLAQICKVLDNKKVIQDFVNAVEGHAIQMLKSGVEIPGYKLVRGRERRVFASEQEIIDTYGGKVDLYEKKMLSPAKLEKAIRSANLVKTLKEAKEDVNKHVTVLEGNLTIAPEYDKRSAVTLAEHMFDKIE